MYTFRFVYDNKKHVFQDFKGIIRAEHDNIVIEEKEFETYKFPTDTTIYLYSENSRYIAAPNNIKYITVQKET